MKTLTIIDTFGILFRSFYAIKGLASSKGHASGMINGFANFIFSLDEDNSDMVIFALDAKGKTFRSELDEAYKMNRPSPPKELKEQLQVCIEMIEKMGLTHMSVSGYEADDIIASVVKECEDKDIFIRIVTTDKDLYQLIRDGKVEIFSPISKRSYDEAACVEKYGVHPSKIRDFLAICGDTADNIPGVKGIGPKGAKTLLESFSDLEDIYENLAIVGNERSKKLLKESRDMAFLSKKLATLYDGLDCTSLLYQEKVENPLLKITDILEKYELKTLLKKLSLKPKKSEAKLSFKTTLIKDKESLQALLSNLDDQKILAFDTESTSLDVKTAKLVGFSFAYNENEGFYVPINHVDFKMDEDLVKWAISQIYKAYVVGHNLKYDFELIKNNLNLSYPKKYADTMIMAWLKDPSLRVNMDELAKRYFDYTCLSFSDLVPKGQTFRDLPHEKAAFYAAEDAVITLNFYLYLLKSLNKDEINLARDLEFPFIELILMMEENGFLLDFNKLQTLQDELSLSLKTLETQIFALANEKFNINSPKQVGEILFVTLSLPNPKKNKTGYKTDEATLKPLAKEYKIAGLILEYRELAKLISTYCEPLIALAKKDANSRIYSHFLQTGTATGRLSSNNPNLQNIPSRGQYAKAYKSCFKARPGYTLLALDYSQIELRLLAHFSKDEKLVNAFKEGEDIHANTALNIFGEVNPHNRSVAKSINFGLIYGMGARSLSQTLDISLSDAKEYIEKYFATFPSIKDYFAKTKLKAKEDGFIETLFKRRRYFDFKTAGPRELAMYERECVNSILQGSAADIIKKAMQEIKPFLDKEHLLLLQIHDELIFEVKDEEIKDFSKIISKIMKNCVKLNINLKTSLKIGKNWGELKEEKWI